MTFEPLESLRISAESPGVILPRESVSSDSKNESIKNTVQPVTNDRKNSSFLAHSNGINNRLDSYDNEKAKIISIIARDLSKGKTPKIENLLRVVELEIKVETALSQYDSKNFKENKIYSKAREVFPDFVERLVRNNDFIR